MSQALEYKGIKSTRIQLGLICMLGVTAGWIWADVTSQQWIDFMEWVLSSYMLSEVGVKSAVAFKEKVK